MDSDYAQALNGFHSQMSAYAGNLGMFQEQKDIYSQQLQSAKEGAMKKISDDKITDAVEAVAGLGAYAAKKVSLEDFKKRVEAGAFKGDTYRGYADKLRAKAGVQTKRMAEDADEDAPKLGEVLPEEATEGLEATTGVAETGAAAEGAGQSAVGAATDAAEAAETALRSAGVGRILADKAADDAGEFGEDGQFAADVAEGGANDVEGQAVELTGEADTTINFGTVDGELVGTSAIDAGETVGGAAGQAAADTTTAALNGIGDAAAGISDTVGTAGAAASGAVEAGIGIGTQVATDSALAVAGGLDAVGTVLDATGIGAGVGVILQVAAVGEGLAGMYDAGKEIYDNVKKVGTDAIQSAQQAVQKVGVMKENWKSVLPTYDTSELIHSSGAW